MAQHYKGAWDDDGTPGSLSAPSYSSPSLSLYPLAPYSLLYHITCICPRYTSRYLAPNYRGFAFYAVFCTANKTVKASHLISFRPATLEAMMAFQPLVYVMRLHANNAPAAERLVACVHCTNARNAGRHTHTHLHTDSHTHTHRQAHTYTYICI